MLRVGTSDLMEDWKFAGGIQISPDLNNNEYLLTTQYLKKRLDYGFTYYRNTIKNPPLYDDSLQFNAKEYTNLYQLTISYPFNKITQPPVQRGFRSDKYVALSDGIQSLKDQDRKYNYALVHVEYVYDDAINPAQNIWFGLRWKVYFDWNTRISKVSGQTADNPYTINFGFDARHYLPIYRNIIWAVRGSRRFFVGA